MSALFLMLTVFALLHLPGLRSLAPFRSRRDKAASAMAGLFLFTGADHFLHPARYVGMIPPALPAPLTLTYVSGFFEMAGAIGLLIPRTRRWAAGGLVTLLIAIFPANIYVAFAGLTVEGLPAARWYYWVRLPIQFIFLAWALWLARSKEE
jgi:uncharacterized membrane protein